MYVVRVAIYGTSRRWDVFTQTWGMKHIMCLNCVRRGPCTCTLVFLAWDFVTVYSTVVFCSAVCFQVCGKQFGNGPSLFQKTLKAKSRKQWFSSFIFLLHPSHFGTTGPCDSRVFMLQWQLQLCVFTGVSKLFFFMNAPPDPICLTVVSDCWLKYVHMKMNRSTVIVFMLC